MTEKTITIKNKQNRLLAKPIKNADFIRGKSY